MRLSTVAVFVFLGLFFFPVRVHFYAAFRSFCPSSKNHTALKAHTVEILGTIVAIWQPAVAANREGGVLQSPADHAGPFGELKVPYPTKCDRT